MTETRPSPILGAALAAYEAARAQGYEGVSTHSTDRACDAPAGYLCLTCRGPLALLARRAETE